MESQDRGNVRITGAGRVEGGSYENITISGSGTIAGNVQAESISITGSGAIEGNVTVETFRGSGSFRIAGNIVVENLHSSGSGVVEGDVQAATLKSSGAWRTSGNLRASEVTFAGSATIGGDVEAEEFRSEAALDIDGLLNADVVEIDLRSNSRVREIGGSRIRVISQSEYKSFLGFRWGARGFTLKADSIEGDDIHLEGTRAAVVRGRRVKIGPGCDVESVEYTESLQIDPKARVGSHSCPDARPAQRAEVISTRPVRRDLGTWSRTCTVNIGGREVRNPILRAIAVIFGLLIAAAAVILVLVAVLPAVGVIVALVLGGVVALLLLLAIGLPAFILVGVPMMIVLAILIRILLLPLDLVRWLLRLRRRTAR